MSDLRSLTSAANGRRSNGPVTVAGKRRSSRNAMRHGLLSRCLVLENESPEAFQSLLAGHLERFQPVDDTELAIVEEITAAVWRLRRSWAIETRMLDSTEVSPDAASDPLSRIASAFADRAQSAALPLAHRYETRLHMIYQRALHNFLLLRAAVPAPIEDPVLHLEPSSPKALPEPAADLPGTVELPNEPN